MTHRRKRFRFLLATSMTVLTSCNSTSKTTSVRDASVPGASPDRLDSGGVAAKDADGSIAAEAQDARLEVAPASDSAAGAGGTGGNTGAPVVDSGGGPGRGGADGGGGKGSDAGGSDRPTNVDTHASPDGAGGSGGGASTKGLDASGGGGGSETSGTSGTWSKGAPESRPSGYGQATTGGGSASVVEVSSLEDLQAAIDAYSGSGGLSLRYTGKFDDSSITDPCTQWKLDANTLEIKKKSDITIVGADASAAHFGIHIAASSSNIIIRNMRFGLLAGAGDSDAISLEGMSSSFPRNVWIDHNELWSSMVECEGAGDTSFDGLIDMKKGADNVTVSYNYLHDHHKVSLNGYSDSDTATRHVTFHHNIFENVGSRTPLQRGGFSHLLNNYFHQVSTSGANIRMKGYSLIEGNFFEDVQNPVTSRDSDEIGYWELRHNNISQPADFSRYGITWEPSTSKPTVDATDWTTTAVFPEELGYQYTSDPPQCVKDGLARVAGAGKGLATLKCQ